ncbi:hypothetical protein BgiMline_001041 [Biomphalaria glabrata]|uniref:Protein C1orf43 homolog n=1 Tax=Biomphalaria glabrata TaxID=6526 RepID=A0A2C9LG40_BIOGL|nr:protein C1orf43 homolog [Biomphalaria glabrata]KAI8768943.1 protein C1orf43-like protein isoform X2 [Biomphalaria glabrata]KAI8789171.1 protein C1orf43 isoform X2 [Biomphalaria glabrata]
MSTEFSIVTVVLLIAAGILVFLVLFLFAKRQIFRFALKSARKPHVIIGADVPKALRDKIHACLKMTEEIYYEPTLLSEQVQNAAYSVENTYYYRMKALDAFSNAVTTLQLNDPLLPHREAKQSIQLYLFCLCPSVVGNKQSKMIQSFAQMYMHARHSPLVFGEKELVKYMELLEKVLRLIKMDQKRRSKSLQTVDLEVQLKKGSKGSETTTKRYENILMEEIRHKGGAPSLEMMDRPPAHRDMSSGYSSTDRSSSQGSADRLLMIHDKRV